MAQASIERVMLVDDSRIDNYVNQKALERDEFAQEILVFNRAANALKYLADPAKELPSVILLDAMMPEIDGFGFLDRFRLLPETTRKQCKVVILSSLIPSAMVKYRMIYPEVLDWMQKPLLGSNLDRLRRTLMMHRAVAV